jgi:hypothetical protein
MTTKLEQRTVAEQLSSAIVARKNCESRDDVGGWMAKWSEVISNVEKNHLPHGAGFDNGTTIMLDHSDECMMAFETSFHHMDDNGMYDGWTEHKVFVRSAFNGFEIEITGDDRNDILDYIAEVFECALSTKLTRAEHCALHGMPDDGR